MKRKLNLLCYCFWPEAPTRLQNRKKCKLSADTALPAQTCTAGTVPVARDPPFTCAHLTSGPNPQMFSTTTTDTPAHLCVERVTASISKSDIIGAAIKK